MEVVHNFNKGIELDSVKTQQPPNTYRSANNVRLMPQSDGTLGAIMNMDGNTLQVSFPDTSNVSQITLLNPTFTSLSFTLTINAVPVAISTTNTTFFQDVSNAINASLAVQALGITSSYSETQVLLWSVLNSSNATITVLVNPTINPSVSAQGVVITQSLIPSQSGIQPIGWVTIREELIFITTNNTTKNPGGHNFDPTIPTDPNSIGQIWSYNYNVETNIGVLRLLYNNVLDLTTFYSIATTAIEGRYENTLTKRIYWTDFYNKIRHFNTADPNGFAIDPTLLERRTETLSTIPVLQNIGDSGGSIEVGMYQVVYRLKITGGSNTQFFEPSNLVSIVQPAESVGFLGFVGSTIGTATTKTITWKIDPVDTKYDRIEVAIIKRLTNETITVIETFREDPVPLSGQYSFTYTGKEVTIPLDLNTILKVESEFTHCKTIASKDNRLLVANVRNQKFDINFDARAYRFNSKTLLSRKAEVKDIQGNSIFIDASTPIWSAIPETHDAINPDQSSQNDNSYRFQTDGTTIGGEGPNIKYSFDVTRLPGDQNIGQDGAGNYGFGLMNLDDPSGVIGYNGRFTNVGAPSEVINEITYPNNNFIDSFKSPYRASVLKGYQHDEVYRFGIKFYDKAGRSSFVKWIGDIKMPMIYEAISPYPTGMYSYPLSEIQIFGGFSQEVVGVLEPVFDVTIPQNLQSQIGGWEIVRVKRNTTDRTVMAAGSIHELVFDSTGGTFYAADSTDFTYPVGHAGVFRSPEFTFASFPGYSTGDKIKVLAIQKNSYNTFSTDPAAPEQFGFAKNYETLPPTSLNTFLEENLQDAVHLGKGADGFMSGLPVRNRVLYEPSNKQRTLGDDCVVLDWRGSTTPLPAITATNLSKYYAVYKRVNLSQYGGNSYTQRSNNTYMSCGYFQSMPSTSTTLNFSVKIFGGDIFTCIWDTQKNIKDWVTTPQPPGDFKTSLTYYQPVQTKFNIEWRTGVTVNTKGFENNGTGIDNGEDYNCEQIYSSENDTIPSYPKPAVFTSIDEFDTRVFASDLKIDGETSDSWLSFLTNNYRDVEGGYGPVNAIFVFNSQLMFLQNQAFGVIPVNQRVLIQDQSASTLQLGTGDVLERHSYISSNVGTKHQNSVVVSNIGVYFFDIHTTMLHKFDRVLKQLSTVDGVYSYLGSNVIGTVLNTDKPVYKDPTLSNSRSGIIAGIDSSFGEVLITIMTGDSLNPTSGESSFTLIYNEILDCFASFTDFKPSMYIYDKFNLITPNTSNPSQLWMHNQNDYGSYYGTIYPSKVTIVSNPQPAYNKVFDNISYYTEVLDNEVDQQLETFDLARFYTDYQNTDFVTLDPISNKNIKREERTWNTQVFRNVVNKTLINPDIFDSTNFLSGQKFKDRIRDKTLTIDLVYNNTLGRKLVFHWLKLLFRPSIR